MLKSGGKATPAEWDGENQISFNFSAYKAVIILFRTGDGSECLHSVIVPTTCKTFKYEIVNLAYRTITLTSSSISWGISSHAAYPSAMILPIAVFAIR